MWHPSRRPGTWCALAISPTRTTWSRLTVEDLARAAGLSRGALQPGVRRAFGESPHVYLLTRRLERPRRCCLGEHRSSVATSASPFGLDSIGSFTTSFTRMFGRSPMAYRAASRRRPDRALIPACVLRGLRPPATPTFRETGSSPAE